MAAGWCGTPLDRNAAKVLHLRRIAVWCGAGATGLEPATSGVTGDPTGFWRVAEVHETPAQGRFPNWFDEKRNDGPEGGFRASWTRCGRALAGECPDLLEDCEDVEVVSDLARL